MRISQQIPITPGLERQRERGRDWSESELERDSVCDYDRVRVKESERDWKIVKSERESERAGKNECERVKVTGRVRENEREGNII